MAFTFFKPRRNTANDIDNDFIPMFDTDVDFHMRFYC